MLGNTNYGIRNDRSISFDESNHIWQNSDLWLTVQQLWAHTMCPASFESSLYIIGSSEVCVNKSSLYYFKWEKKIKTHFLIVETPGFYWNSIGWYFITLTDQRRRKGSSIGGNRIFFAITILKFRFPQLPNEIEISFGKRWLDCSPSAPTVSTSLQMWYRCGQPKPPLTTQALLK